MKVLILLALLSVAIVSSEAFEIAVSRNQAQQLSLSAKPSPTDNDDPSIHTTPSTTSAKKKDNSAMAFLRKVGKIGGAANHDYTFATGVDEGPSDKTEGEKGAKVRSMLGLVVL
jgi:hypothetical protein